MESNSNSPSEDNTIPKKDEIPSTPNVNLKTSSQHISKAYIFSFIRTYSSIPLNFLLNFLIASFLDKTYWGIMLFSFAIFSIAKIALNFFPPSVPSVFFFKIPELMKKNQLGKVKGYVHYVLTVFTIAALTNIFFFVVYIFLIHPAGTSPYFVLLIIQAPAIFLEGLIGVLNHINFIFKNYSVDLYLFFQERVLTLILYLYLFFNRIDGETTIYILTFLTVVIRILSMPVLYFYYRKFLGKVKLEKFYWSEFKVTIKYGLKFSILDSFNLLYSYMYSYFLTYKGEIYYNTYNNIGNNLITQTQSALSVPIGPVLTDLYNAKQNEKLILLFKKILDYTNILLCYIICGVFFFVDIYIKYIYGPNYVEIIKILQIFVFGAFFFNIENNIRLYLSVLQDSITILYIEIVGTIIGIVSAFIGIVYFGFAGILYSRILTSIIKIIISLIYCSKADKLKISSLFLFRHIFVVILIVFITQGLFKVINIFLPITNVFLIFGVNTSLAIIIFTAYIFIFRIIKKQDLNDLEKVPIKIPFKQPIFKILKYISKD